MLKIQIMRSGLLFSFLMLSLFARSQDVTGIWRGHFRGTEIYQRLTGNDDRYKMEVQIAQDKKFFKAVTYSYRSTFFYGKAEAQGSVDAKTNKVLLKELKIVELRMIGGDACIMTCYMQYSKLGEDEFLEGTYTSANTRDSSDCGRGTIFLHKVASSDFYKEPFLEKKEKEKEAVHEPAKIVPPPAGKKNSAPAKAAPSASTAKKSTAPTQPVHTSPKPASTVKTSPKPVSKAPVKEKTLAKTNLSKQQIETLHKDTIRSLDKKTIPFPVPKELASRSNELVRTIEVNSPDVELDIYDDGIVDNDTVSVYFDNRLIISKARLTTQPIIAKIHLDETSSSHEVIMVAENLGDIPPNTSLMVVHAGDKKFEVRIVSTEQKNAVVVFKYTKPE